MTSFPHLLLALIIPFSACSLVFDTSDTSGAERDGQGPDDATTAIDGATLPDASAPDGSLPPPPICDSDNPDLLLCLQFEGNFGQPSETPVPDESALAHTAWVSGGISVPGKHGQALRTSNSFFSSIIVPSAALDNAQTIEMWVKPDDTNQLYQGLLEGNSYWFYITNGTHLACDSPDTVDNRPFSKLPVLTANVWQHVACVFKNQKTFIYVDGVEITDKEITDKVNRESWAALLAKDRYSFGRPSPFWTNSPSRFRGAIDTLRVWKSARDGLICPVCSVPE